FPYVPPDVELGVVLPAGKSYAEWRRHDVLEVARQKRQFRFHEVNAIFKGDLSVERAHAGDIQRHTFALQVKEDGVSPGKAVTLGLILHEILRQFTNEKRRDSRASFSVLYTFTFTPLKTTLTRLSSALRARSSSARMAPASMRAMQEKSMFSSPSSPLSWAAALRRPEIMSVSLRLIGMNSTSLRNCGDPRQLAGERCSPWTPRDLHKPSRKARPTRPLGACADSTARKDRRRPLSPSPARHARIHLAGCRVRRWIAETRAGRAVVRSRQSASQPFPAPLGLPGPAGR